MIFQIIIFIIVLSFLVIIHELGHYLSARFFKVRVQEFGIGYPPRALTLFKHGKTIFSLNWIPFGGFVQMEGEEGSESTMVGLEDVPSQEVQTAVKSDKKAHATSASQEGPFYEKSKFARLVITLAGAAVNFVFGIIAFSVFFSLTGIPELANNARIGEVLADTPAAVAKVPANVEVVAVEVNGNEVIPVDSPDKVVEVISVRSNQQITLITTGPCQENEGGCQEMAQRFTMTVQPKVDDPSRGIVGIRFTPVVISKFYPWYEMPVRGTWVGLQQTAYLTKMIFGALGNIGRSISQGSVPQEVGSPVKIFVESRNAGIFEQGPGTLLNFAGIISINLAIFNVLPIPALDGGRVVLILLEYIIGRRKVSQIEGYVNYAGFLALGSLMIFVFAKDILEVVMSLV